MPAISHSSSHAASAELPLAIPVDPNDMDGMARSGKALGKISDPGFRNRLMARVRQRDTRPCPEMIVRKILTSLGYRYRLNRRDLPGSPDIVFIGKRKILFVHGCFWHAHQGCRFATVPKTRTEYWTEKLASNRRRDERVEQALRDTGWNVAVIWECRQRCRRF